MKAASRKIWSKRKGWATILLVIVMVIAIPLAAFAENGDGSGPSPGGGGGAGDGSGSGTPGAKPLSFISATLTNDGANVIDSESIPLKARIKLLFDKNVVNSTVWEINRNCFSLIDRDGLDVPIVVIKVDDTISFDERQAIFVEPLEELKPGTSYNLKVSPELKAKNGVSTLGGTTSGRGITIVFKTIVEALSSSKPAEDLGVQAGTKTVPVPTVSATNKLAPTASKKVEIQAAEAQEDSSDEQASAPSPLAGNAAKTGSGVPAPLAAPSPGSGSSAVVTSPKPHGTETVAGNNAADTGSSESPALGSSELSQAPAVQSGSAQLKSVATSDVAAATDLGASADPHWQFMMSLAAVLLAGWVLAEVFYLRRWRVRKRLNAMNKSDKEQLKD